MDLVGERKIEFSQVDLSFLVSPEVKSSAKDQSMVPQRMRRERRMYGKGKVWLDCQLVLGIH